jgi:hypothetical protein
MEITHDITIEELYIPSKHDKESYLCENFIIYPDGKEKNGGYLLGIIEIRATPKDEAAKIIKIVTNTLKEQYYNQIRTSPDPQKLNLETVFEHALQKTNEALLEMIQIGHISFALENLNYLIAATKPNEKARDIDFYFSHQGLIQAFLLHKTKQNNYKVINIIDNTPKLKEEPNKIKIFSSILSGKVFYHDAIFLCSEIFNNYIPAHKVNKILSNNDLKSAMDYFKNLINNVRNNSFLTYSAIFIKLEEKREMADKPVSQRSMAQLMSTKDVTEKYLTPTFAINLRDYLNKFLDLFKRAKAQKLQGPQTAKHTRLAFLTSVPALFGNIFAKIKRPSKESKNEETKEPRKWLNKKMIIIVAIALVVLTVPTAFWVKHRQTVKKEAAVYAQQLKDLRDNINNAQVNLIYKNDAKSLELIKISEESLNKLSRKNTNQEANYQEMAKQIDTIKGKILKIEKVAPQLILEITDEANISVKSMQMVDTKLAAGGGTNTLYLIDPESKTISKKLRSSAGEIRTIRETDGSLVVFTNESRLLKSDKGTTDFIEMTINWNNISLTDFQLYNNNLYVTDKGVYKFTGAGKDFGASQNWIKDANGADLAQTISLAIDGNVYVLTQSGSLYKFLSGKREDLSSLAIEPALSNNATLFTTKDSKNLYILDSAKKRVAILDKAGLLIKQFIFDSITDEITSLAISKDETKIFVATKNKIYQTSFTK